jgi:hypothetical protein
MRCKFLFTLFLLVGWNVFLVKAQPIQRHDAWKCLHRTALAIFEARREVSSGKVDSVDLARAIMHQRFAKKLFLDGKFIHSIHHSLRARRLAFTVISANKGIVKEEWKADLTEGWYQKSSATDDDLDKEVPDYGKQKDIDILSSDIKDIDVPAEK